MSLAAGLTAFRDKTARKLSEVERGVVLSVGENVVGDLSPVGDPLLWKRAPPADYVPGNFRSSWFYSAGGPSRERTTATNITEVNGIDGLGEGEGRKHFLTNNAPHATAIEAGHSTQAPVGILGPIIARFEGIVAEVVLQVRQ